MADLYNGEGGRWAFAGGGGVRPFRSAKAPVCTLEFDDVRLEINSRWMDLELRATREEVRHVCLLVRPMGTRITVEYHDGTRPKQYFATPTASVIDTALLSAGWRVRKEYSPPWSWLRRVRGLPSEINVEPDRTA